MTLTVSADGAHTNLRRSNKNHMYIRLESPAGACVKHSITGIWGPEDDKCGPQESVIVSGIKGPPSLEEKQAGNGVAERKKRRSAERRMATERQTGQAGRPSDTVGGL